MSAKANGNTIQGKFKRELVLWSGVAALTMLWYAAVIYLGQRHIGETAMITVNALLAVILGIIVVGLAVNVYMYRQVLLEGDDAE